MRNLQKLPRVFMAFVLPAMLLPGALTRAEDSFSGATTAPSANKLPATIVIAPFQTTGGGDASRWMGDAMQADLAQQIRRSDLGTPVVLPPDTASDPATLLRIAHETGAVFAVSGACEISGDQLAVNGDIIDVQSGKTVGYLRAAGELKDLFHLEDTLDRELTAGLNVAMAAMPPVANNPASPGIAVAADPVAAAPTEIAPTYAAPPPMYVPSYTAAPYDYSAPYTYVSPYETPGYFSTFSGSGYPYYYGSNYGYPFFFGGYYTRGDFHHDHHDDWRQDHHRTYAPPVYTAPRYNAPRSAEPRHALSGSGRR